MALEKDFLFMTSTTVQVAALSTIGPYGAPSYSTSPSTYDAYIEPGTRKVVTREGEEEIATAMVFVFSSSASIAPSAKLTLPSGLTPRILRVDPVNDEQGQHHIEIAIG